MTKSNPETMGRFHTDWLNMIYPRLQLASYLLKEDGVIFVSIDDHEVHNLRKLMDEVFGEENFVGSYIKQSKVGGGSDSKHIVKEHEYVLCYAKQIIQLNEMFIEQDEAYLKRYKEEDEIGIYFWDTFARPGLKNPIVYDIIAPDGTIITHGWIRSKDRFEKEYKDGTIRIIKKPNGEWSVQFKQYLNKAGKKPRSMTMDFGGTIEGKSELFKLFNNDKIFSYPKSIKFIQQLMKTTTSKDDIILDFFAGSSTTAHAVMALNAADGGNRRFIMVQLPELCGPKSEAYQAGYTNICEIGKERIHRAGKQLLDQERETLATREEPLDVGFRVLKLDTSNFIEWDSTYLKPTELDQLSDRLNAMEKSIKPDRTDYDVLLEVMLKFSINPNNPITPLTVGKRKCYTLGEKRLILVCLDPFIDDEDLHAMCDIAPEKIVASEETFKDDNALASAYFLLQQRGIEIELI